MSNYPKKAGVYKLTCGNNGKIYIGKSINISLRLYRHKYSEKQTKGRCYFENAILKHGWDSFQVEILEIFENFDKNDNNHKQQLLEKEAYFIELYKSTDKTIGYNRCKFSTDGTGIVGSPLSDKHKEKIRQGNLGKIVTEETREKLRKAKLGTHRTDDTKMKISRFNSGKKLSEEHKEKIRQSNIGKHQRSFTEEHKEKIRQSKIGKCRKPFTDEHKEKIRQSKLLKQSKIEN